MVFDSGDGLSTAEQEYNPAPIVNEIWTHVESWRNLPQSRAVAGYARDLALAPALAPPSVSERSPVLLSGRGGRDNHLADRGRTEARQARKKFWAHIKGANEQANPELLRLALKLATGAGKVMAMLIAWQTGAWQSALKSLPSVGGRSSRPRPDSRKSIPEFGLADA